MKVNPTTQSAMYFEETTLNRLIIGRQTHLIFIRLEMLKLLQNQTNKWLNSLIRFRKNKSELLNLI